MHWSNEHQAYCVSELETAPITARMQKSPVEQSRNRSERATRERFRRGLKTNGCGEGGFGFGILSRYVSLGIQTTLFTVIYSEVQIRLN